MNEVGAEHRHQQRWAVMFTAACFALSLTACGADEAPYVSDQRLDDALLALEEAGYSDDSVIIEPASNYAGDWTVCSQDPVAGTTTERVRLRVGEICRDGNPVDPSHEGEDAFAGVITRYDFNASNEPLVVVDEAVLRLDLIHTIGDSECPKTGERFGDKAVQALTRSRPVGTPVSVVRASASSQEAFIHQLNAISDSPSPEPPQGSVNQELVSGGYWTPSKDSFVMPKKGERTSRYLEGDVNLTPVELSYTPLIADAATTARLKEVKGQRLCMAEAQRVIEERQAAKAAAAAAAAERRYQRWLDKQQDDSDDDWNTPSAPQVPSGEHPCLPGERDGDGDGICAEE